MDQTSIELDSPGNYTYTKKGSQRVDAVTAGGERVKLSIAFCFSADG